MTRKEYMEQLEKKLGFLNEENLHAMLDYYAEMLDDRMEDGQDEESAVSAMETPDEIADRLMKEREENPAQDSPAPEAPEMTDEAMRFSSLVENVMKAASQAGAAAQTAAAEAARQISEELPQELSRAAGEVESAVKEEANKHGDYQRCTFTCDADDLRGVNLSCSDMPVRVTGCDGSKATLIYYTCEIDPYQASVENGILYLRRLETSHGAGRFALNIFGGMLRFAWNKSSPTVELFLPRDALVDLTVHSSNASVKADDLRALCQVEAHTSNSRVSIKNITCKALTAQTSNGRVELENVSSKLSIRGKSSNGRIVAQMVKSGADLNLQTSNGRIVMEDSNASGELSLITSNSHVEISRSNAPSINLRTSNGGVRGTLPGVQTDWNIVSSTSNGHNSLPTRQPGQKSLTVRTSNGSIDVHFEGNA